MPTLDEQKQALRSRLSLVRQAAFDANPQAGEALALEFHDALVPGSVVAGTLPFRSEIDPRPLMFRLREVGARLALPVTAPRGVDAPLTFRAWTPGDRLVKSPFGVLEPLDDAECLVPDLVLVPLLAFDRTGARLGFGQGHYDRTLTWLRAERSLVAIGLAFADQEVDRVPTGPHDARLDVIITERELIHVSD